MHAHSAVNCGHGYSCGVFLWFVIEVQSGMGFLRRTPVVIYSIFEIGQLIKFIIKMLEANKDEHKRGKQ